MKRKKGFYSISVVAKMFTVHQQTIRMYEKEGLINPKRTAGNTRLFSEEDVDRLEEIIYLTHKVGVNLAGVEMILKLKKKMKKLQDEINKSLSLAQLQLDEETEIFKREVKQNTQRLIDLKKEDVKKESLFDVESDVTVDDEPKKRETSTQRTSLIKTAGQSLDRARSTKSDDWEIEYDDESFSRKNKGK